MQISRQPLQRTQVARAAASDSLGSPPEEEPFIPQNSKFLHSPQAPSAARAVLGCWQGHFHFSLACRRFPEWLGPQPEVMLGVFRHTAQKEEHRWIPQSRSQHRAMSHLRPSCRGACSTGEVCEQILAFAAQSWVTGPEEPWYSRHKVREWSWEGRGSLRAQAVGRSVPCGWPVCRKHGVRSSACSTWKERAYRAPGSEAVGLRQPWRIQVPCPFILYLWRLSSGTACP